MFIEKKNILKNPILKSKKNCRSSYNLHLQIANVFKLKFAITVYGLRDSNLLELLVATIATVYFFQHFFSTIIDLTATT